MRLDTEASFWRVFGGVGDGGWGMGDGGWGLMFLNLLLLHRSKEATSYDAILIFNYFLSTWWTCTRAWYAGKCWKKLMLCLSSRGYNCEHRITSY